MPPALQQATADPRLCQRLLNTHGQVWVSLLWGHCSFLLGPGAHKLLSVPSKRVFPLSYVSSGGSMVGLMATSSKRAYAIPRSVAPRAPAPAAVHCWPITPHETRNTWTNRQICLWSTEWSRAKANGVCQGNALVIANTLFQQYKRRLYTWISPDGQYQNQIDYILCSQRWRSTIQSAKTRQDADCGSDHELLIAKFRFKLKKVGETTRPFRYNLNQIPYDYTLDVRNRLKGLDLIDRVPEELWMEVCHCMGGNDQDHTQKKKEI